MSLLVLPTGMSVRPTDPELDREGQSHGYLFRDTVLGDVGMLLVRIWMDVKNPAATTGFFHVEALGEPDDPMTARRKACFDSVADEITAVLNALPALNTIEDVSAILPLDTSTTVRPLHYRRQQSKDLLCAKCHQDAVMLYYSDARSPAEFYDVARHSYAAVALASEMGAGLVAWVVGEETTSLSDDERYFPVMQFYPEYAPVRMYSKQEIAQLTSAAVRRHCPPTIVSH
ncbi:hypothetical protein QCD60_30170 [Pokkaliibacter sp. MBI-7]|uniref:hypothetical protein n=1 Tax=Pokkaliibacter sp. MBI-7 TaxID=3040600 RepID=UPI00244A34A0|nr:hypothetical protein [Pokkaliibacter sp. MBI-7]MDH2430987.1 hypothetical protein [Pokkaliibacter sp. MBI-7]MDH2436782.1 hypothetical protein [Pokkaliibacter sp. MBI-7]